MNTAFVMFSVCLLFFVMVPAIETKKPLLIVLAMLLIASVSGAWYLLPGEESLTAIAVKTLTSTFSALILGFIYSCIKNFEKRHKHEGEDTDISN